MSALIAVLHLHLSIARDLLEGKVALYADKSFALSMAVDSRSSEDVNLVLSFILIAGKLAIHNSGCQNQSLASLPASRMKLKTRTIRNTRSGVIVWTLEALACRN